MRVMGTLSEAHRYADAGLYVIPIREGGKRPAMRTGKEHARLATVDHDTIDWWFGTHPEWNVGIACTPSRLVVIDVDGPEGERALADIQAEHGKLPETWETWTSRGRHLYYRWPDGQRITTGTAGPKLDIRAAGSYVVAPPSTHPSGDVYEWGVTGVPIPDAPGWLARRPPAKRRRKRTVRAVDQSVGDEAAAVVSELIDTVSLRLERDGYLKAAAALESMR